ncbi:MAG: hypothetical protein H7829_17090 [Magnetococcus sp. THC-1_WYH]
MAEQQARVYTLAAPTGGWNTRDPVAGMKAESASIMDNFFPEPGTVLMRRGSTTWATGLPAAVKSLIEYTPETGTGELFAVSDGGIYSVTGSGAVGAAVVSGLSTSIVNSVQMGTSGGHFALVFTGGDAPRIYNGTTWGTTPAITGPTAANLIWASVHHNRLWVGEVNSLSGWYLAVDSIGGAAAEFDFSSISTRGGYLVGMGTWTRDAGDGPDDVAVFLTSEGEVFIYQGTDPSSISTWGLTGVFKVGKPIGRKCMVKAGPDLLIVTEDGIIAVSSIFNQDHSQQASTALSAAINPTINASVRSYGSLHGWQPIIYPKGMQLILNVPISSTTAYQYVWNTVTRAACRFTGMPALCWGLLSGAPYFGTPSGTVVQYDIGTSDNGSAIAGNVVQAFSNCGTNNNKSFKKVDLLIQSAGNPSIAIDLHLDYQVSTPTGIAQESPSPAALWGVSLWGSGLWGTNNQIYRGWRGVTGIARTVALRVRSSTTTTRPGWVSTTFSYIVGAMV